MIKGLSLLLALEGQVPGQSTSTTVSGWPNRCPQMFASWITPVSQPSTSSTKLTPGVLVYSSVFDIIL
jgi:hypothetical protein